MSLVSVSPFLTAARETGPTVIGPFPARRLAKATHNKAALKQSGETRTTRFGKKVKGIHRGEHHSREWSI